MRPLERLIRRRVDSPGFDAFTREALEVVFLLELLDEARLRIAALSEPQPDVAFVGASDVTYVDKKIAAVRCIGGETQVMFRGDHLPSMENWLCVGTNIRLSRDPGELVGGTVRYIGESGYVVGVSYYEDV